MYRFSDTEQEKITKAILGYLKKHELALSCGAEYIYQSDSAQVDAVNLVCDIFESINGVNWKEI